MSRYGSLININPSGNILSTDEHDSEKSALNIDRLLQLKASAELVECYK